MAQQATVVSRPVQPRLDDGRHWRAKLGFIVLAMEQTVESDVMAMTPEGVGVHFARIFMSNDATLETLPTMAPDIGNTAGLLLPYEPPAVICYTCNSGAMVIGEEKCMDVIKGVQPQAEPTTVITGVLRAMEALGTRRIAVATPYLDEINTVVNDFLTRAGFEVIEFQGMNLKSNNEIDRVTPDFIKDYVRSINTPEAEAILICCGALRALDVIQELEDELGKPVIASNQAMMWDCMRLAGLDDHIEGFGQIFELDGARHKLAVEALAARQNKGA
jgi:maleate isomerase